MWDLFETVRHRHSIRRYQMDIPVENEKLHAILETACAAPSAGDLQSYKIIVVTGQTVRNRLRVAAGEQSFISEAPVYLVFCADTQRASQQFSKRGETLYAVQDATIAAAYSQLAIVAAGMGSTWIGNFDEAEVSELLELEEGLIPVALLSLGYPAELPEPTPRRRMDEITRFIPPQP